MPARRQGGHMRAHYAQQAYMQAAIQPEQDPKKLILMLYEGALKHLRLAKEGFQEHDTHKQGENLSRTIAIVSALHASLDDNIRDEPIEFLRGLYVSMMVELAKVAVTHETQTLDRAVRYLEYLKDIWEKQVMNISAANSTAHAWKQPQRHDTTQTETAMGASYATVAQNIRRMLAAS
ncbi:flagellar export chaperone FliS [Candidatus Parcubacteria bacterium]|nr:MAG: flagellar export chaperone FliS [Candidatus Parcubacteria bacterium]